MMAWQAAGPALGKDADWRSLLEGCEVVVHAAAHVHVAESEADGHIDVFRDVNAAGSLSLARQAAHAGVRRFVFISSIKVNGEETLPGRPFRAEDRPMPTGPYAASKAEAELGLVELAAETGMEYVIIRPPLVYGPGVKANFRSMMEWLASGVPLPLGAVEHNRRSLIALDNLVDLILTCIDHPRAKNMVFLAADGQDLSTSDLLRRLAAAMGVRARLLPVPVPALRAASRLLGKEAVLRRLCGDLQVDISRAQQVLGWVPPIGVDEGFRRTAAGFQG